MKKAYINPTMYVETTAVSTSPLMGSNVNYNSGNKTSNMGGVKVVGDAKERGDDQESDGWSDGLW